MNMYIYVYAAEATSHFGTFFCHNLFSPYPRPPINLQFASFIALIW